jgi:hypothetical protein
MIVVFALQFRGRGTQVSPERRKATTTATSQLHRTRLTATGVEAAVEMLEGVETATLEAEIELVGDGTFVESGRIRYGAAGSVAFETVGRGVRGPSAIPGRVVGAVIWRVVAGDGRFAGATGYITSNFSVDASGDVVDHHVAQLIIPDETPRDGRATTP